MPTELTIVPTFIFHQGTLIYDSDAEFPIQVSYYADGALVEVKMLDESGREIMLRVRDLRRLVREIERHLPSAIEVLKPAKSK